VAVDPDVTALGIAHPQEQVIRVLDCFGLTSRVLLVCGYSFDRVDPGSADVPGANGRATSPDEIEEPPPSGENVLPLLAQLGVRYDLALLDGHHGQETVAAELDYLRGALRPGGLVFLDDVADWCPEIHDLFNHPGERFEQMDHDGRVGVLRFSG
jgi:hypothetical protein